MWGRSYDIFCESVVDLCERLSQLAVKVTKLHKGSSVWLSNSPGRLRWDFNYITMTLTFESTLETSKDKCLNVSLQISFPKLISCLSKYPILQETHCYNCYNSPFKFHPWVPDVILCLLPRQIRLSFSPKCVLYLSSFFQNNNLKLETRKFPRNTKHALGGGFKHFLFSSLFGEDSHFD